MFPASRNTRASIINSEGAILDDCAVIGWAEVALGVFEPVLYCEALGQSLTRSNIIDQLGNVDVVVKFDGHIPTDSDKELALERIESRKKKSGIESFRALHAAN